LSPPNSHSKEACKVYAWNPLCHFGKKKLPSKSLLNIDNSKKDSKTVFMAFLSRAGNEG
jgi:hypothetical protein